MIILLEGKNSTKKINEDSLSVTPFLGADSEGELSTFGVGLKHVVSEKNSLWGTVTPKDVIATYRAMKLLEQIPKIDDEIKTLEACWYAGHSETFDSEQSFVENVEKLLGKEKRQKILNEKIPCLDDLLLDLQRKKIEFNVQPFIKEVNKGTLKNTKVLQGVINEYLDNNLLFHGLTEELKFAYDILKQRPNYFQKFLRPKKYDFNEDLVNLYVEKVEGMISSLIPKTKEIYLDLTKKINGLNELRYDDSSKLETANLIKKIKKHNKLVKKAYDVLTTNNKSVNEKFIQYHEALRTIVFSTKKVSNGIKNLEFHSHPNLYLRKEFQEKKMYSEQIITTINRAARKNMQGLYDIK